MSDFYTKKDPELGPVPQDMMSFHFLAPMAKTANMLHVCCCSSPAQSTTTPAGLLPVPNQYLGCPLFSEMVHFSILYKQSMSS